MPKGLDDAFEATISRIKAQSRPKSELAMDVLKWTFFRRTAIGTTGATTCIGNFTGRYGALLG
jgi:hypothetical protein